MRKKSVGTIGRTAAVLLRSTSIDTYFCEHEDERSQESIPFDAWAEDLLLNNQTGPDSLSTVNSWEISELLIKRNKELDFPSDKFKVINKWASHLANHLLNR